MHEETFYAGMIDSVNAYEPKSPKYWLLEDDHHDFNNIWRNAADEVNLFSIDPTEDLLEGFILENSQRIIPAEWHTEPTFMGGLGDPPKLSCANNA